MRIILASVVAAMAVVSAHATGDCDPGEKGCVCTSSHGTRQICDYQCYVEGGLVHCPQWKFSKTPESPEEPVTYDISQLLKREGFYTHNDTVDGKIWEYRFNIGGAIGNDPYDVDPSCESTHGDSWNSSKHEKKNTWKAAAYQVITSGKDFGCHRLTGDVKKSSNTVVNLIDPFDP